MQIGAGNSFTTNNRSVGQRIKETHLKDAPQFQQLTFSPPCTKEHLNAQQVGATNSRQSSRTICHSCNKKQGLNKSSPVVLNSHQRNTVRVIGQYLRDLGMIETADSLVEESGCRIESPLSIQLRECICRGSWAKSLDIIEKFRPSITEQQYLTIRVLLLEEKFKELFKNGEAIRALRLLQVEYPKHEQVRSRLEHWATILCSPNSPDIFQNQKPIDAENSDTYANYSLNNQHVLNILRKVLPPNLMLPPNRLQELLNQSWVHQVQQCDLHVLSNKDAIENSILVDHQCANNDFPTKNSLTLYLHNAEVWCVQFSPCGRYLASGAKGNNVLVWKIHSPDRITVHLNITIHQDMIGIASLSWSYDSQYLAVASTEENGFGIFVYYVTSGRLVKEFHRSPNYSFSTVSFFKDRSHKLACGDQRGHFQAYNIHSTDESSYSSFEGFRIRCIYSMKDGKTVLAADTHNRIRSYNFETKSEANLIQENSQIMYFTVDSYEKYCLVTTKTEGIRLWCLKTCSLIRTFFGATHSEFIITTSFGGPENNFFASGSEGYPLESNDSVVIWNINCTHPVRKLVGHNGTVNAVSWNPVFHGMFASGSDDGTIKIWSSTNSLMPR